MTDTAPPTEVKLEPAYRSVAAVGLFVILAVSGLAADLASKHYTFESLLSNPDLTARAETIEVPAMGL